MPNSNNNNVDCPICTMPVLPRSNGLRTNGLVTNCGHLFHRKCLTKWAKRNQYAHNNQHVQNDPNAMILNNTTCPMCREPTVHQSLVKDIIDKFHKLEAVAHQFEEAYMRARYDSRKFPNIYLLPTLRNSKLPMKTTEFMVSFILHLLFHSNPTNNQQNGDVKHFKDMLIKLIVTTLDFEETWEHSYGILNKDPTPKMRNSQAGRMYNSIWPYFGTDKERKRFIKYVEYDTEVINVVEYLSNLFYNDILYELRASSNANQLDTRFFNRIISRFGRLTQNG